MVRSLLVLACSLVLLTGCAETELASHWWKSWGTDDRPPAATANANTPMQTGNFKVGRPYEAVGKWYTPSESYSYDETGIASWYGDQFHGKKTANGEIFNKNALTAAHPTLQIPSLVRVTNLDNGRSAVLRINDRGPFAKNRLIDVSHKSADVLGFTNQGTAKVRVQVLERESRIIAESARQGDPPHIQMAKAFRRTEAPEIQVASLDTRPPSASVMASTPLNAPVTSEDMEDLNKQLFRKFPVNPTNIYVQVGSFGNANNAQALKNRLHNIGRADVYQTVIHGQTFNRVRIGPLKNVAEADRVLSRTLAAGHNGAHIVVD